MPNDVTQSDRPHPRVSFGHPAVVDSMRSLTSRSPSFGGTAPQVDQSRKAVEHATRAPCNAADLATTSAVSTILQRLSRPEDLR